MSKNLKTNKKGREAGGRGFEMREERGEGMV
jgi:hypothetical protein